MQVAAKEHNRKIANDALRKIHVEVLLMGAENSRDDCAESVAARSARARFMLRKVRRMRREVDEVATASRDARRIFP